MALTTTTVSSAVAVTDTSIAVTSATGFAAGYLLRIDGEMMKVQSSYVSGTTIPVLRGVDGTAVAAHKVSANITAGLASDYAVPPAGVPMAVTNANVITYTTTSYSAAGAIAFGAAQWTTAIINGTGALAMTLANPTKDQDGIILLIVANGKAAHTVTYTAGLGNGGASFDVGTFSASLQMSAMLVAANGFWVSIGPTSATAMAGSPTWA